MQQLKIVYKNNLYYIIRITINFIRINHILIEGIMKFIDGLEIDETKILFELVKFAKNHRLRQRAHAVILSHKKFTVEELSDIFEVHRDTISRWLNSYEENGIGGLFDAPKSGRPKIYLDRIYKTHIHNFNKSQKVKDSTQNRFSLVNFG